MNNIILHPGYHTDCENVNKYLFGLLPEAQKAKVFNQPYCDIEPGFLGFVDTYYYLSKLIPENFTVIDFGCAYNAQCFFFTQHQKYIAVDLNINTDNAFYAANTVLVSSTIEDYLKVCQEATDTTFAICNYVTTMAARKLVSSRFDNCYCFYPG